MVLRLVVVLTAVAGAITGCGVDSEQAKVCQRLIRAFEPQARDIDVLRHEQHGSAENSIVIHYRAWDPGGKAADHWIGCWFEASAFGPGRLSVQGVSTDRRGLLSPVQVKMLRIWSRIYGAESPATGARARVSGSALSTPLYALQAVFNAIVMGCVYALVAVGFSLLYGVIGRINLALGEISTIAGYGAFTGVALMAAAGVGVGMWFTGLMAVLIAALGVAVMVNVGTERLIFRPLRGSSTQAPLIATIGLALFLRELMRLTQGSRDRWLQPLVIEPYIVAVGAGHAVSVSAAQLAIVGLTVVLGGALAVLMMRSAFGRRYRACCDDFKMAALSGVDAGRTVTLTFALSAVFAGAAGVIIVLYYGTVGAYMGVAIGFKALVAAVVGGMGSLAGAALGGLLIALLESLWSSYHTMAYRDVVVFGLLAFVLVFRPHGLLGRPER